MPNRVTFTDNNYGFRYVMTLKFDGIYWCVDINSCDARNNDSRHYEFLNREDAVRKFSSVYRWNTGKKIQEDSTC